MKKIFLLVIAVLMLPSCTYVSNEDEAQSKKYVIKTNLTEFGPYGVTDTEYRTDTVEVLNDTQAYEKGLVLFYAQKKDEQLIAKDSLSKVAVSFEVINSDGEDISINIPDHVKDSLEVMFEHITNNNNN